ncbi:MAG: hypoxia/intracellular survival transcriptional regulator MosR [Mycobacteriales bacterium]
MAPKAWENLLSPATDDDLGTAGTDVAAVYPPLAPTQTAAALTNRSGALRQHVKLLGQDIEETHQDSYMVEWRVLTNRRAATSAMGLLNELADLGFAWRDLARLTGVSVPAIQKWRKGDGASGPNRRKLASFLAACDLIAQHYHIDEIASWFEMPLLDDAPITPIELWASGDQQLVFEHASGHADPDATLSTFDPQWRERYQTVFETFQDDDGKLGLRMKDR